MKKLMLGITLALALATPSLGRPPLQKPVNNPRPGQSDPTYATPRVYLFPGTVSSLGVGRLVVKANPDAGINGDRVFVTDGSTQMPEGLKSGDRVVVDYDYTMESKVYKAIRVKKLGPNQAFPAARNP